MADRKTKRMGERETPPETPETQDPGRASRIENIRRAIQAGTYKVPSSSIAEAILERMRQPRADADERHERGGSARLRRPS